MPDPKKDTTPDVEYPIVHRRDDGQCTVYRYMFNEAGSYKADGYGVGPTPTSAKYAAMNNPRRIEDGNN